MARISASSAPHVDEEPDWPSTRLSHEARREAARHRHERKPAVRISGPIIDCEISTCAWWAVHQLYRPSYSAQRDHGPLASKAGCLLERVRDLQDAEIIAVTANDLDADG